MSGATLQMTLINYEITIAVKNLPMSCMPKTVGEIACQARTLLAKELKEVDLHYKSYNVHENIEGTRWDWSVTFNAAVLASDL